MRHDALGYWLAEAGGAEPTAPVAGDVDADVVIIGGGYTGMWTAWHVLERDPSARVVVLEAGVCGHGPSGRNGGFCETLWSNLPSLRERFGDERALAACRASSDSVRAIGAWCEAEGVDAWFRSGGFILASTTEAQDKVVDRVLAAADIAPEHVLPLDRAALRERCDSPRFRRGLLVPEDATVQPARLALGLRRRLLERGVTVHERSRVRALRVAPTSVEVETGSARVRAGAAVLAVNAATRGVRPLRSRLSVTSSHIVLTEPVPDVVEQIGWTGGEAITDAPLFIHYFRTTPDGRIAFGWGGGKLAWGARLDGRVEVDAGVVETIQRHLVEMFPVLRGRRITHAWGGPIDVSPSHLPQIGTVSDGPVHYAFGFTGNGVGPSHLAGGVLAGLALGDGDHGLALVDPAPAVVPPEPLAWLGGMLVRGAFLRAERLRTAGRRPDPLTRAICAAPRALGIHVSR
ncbi:MAG TPA: FAD-binding oxidoreductase [Solirubrobacteraceae bacterium]|nr:FAD-binding oxidoreductase [Solirubrobacteraceae bacterium]